MKRALTTLLVIALVGSMMFAGFAGTAAAHADDKKDDNHHDDKDAKNGDEKHDDEADDRNGDNGADGHDGDTQEAAQGVAIDQKSSAEVTQVQESYQANVNDGDQAALAGSYQGSAVASNSVAQSNVNVQAASATSFNVADVDQDSDQDQD